MSAFPRKKKILHLDTCIMTRKMMIMIVIVALKCFFFSGKSDIFSLAVDIMFPIYSRNVCFFDKSCPDKIHSGHFI